MKKLVLALVLVVSSMTAVKAADVATKSWTDGIGVLPFAALDHPNFARPEWGAGVAIDYAVNAKVSLEAELTAFGTDSWGGNVVDRGVILGKYELLKAANNKLHVYGIAGGGYNLVNNNMLFTAGLGASFDVHKNISAFLDTRPYAEFGAGQGQSTRFGINVHF